MLIRPDQFRIIHYAISKVSGAGLIYVLIAIFSLLGRSFDAVEFTNGLLSTGLAYLSAYMIICSVLIDVCTGWIKKNILIKIVLHPVAGMFFVTLFSTDPDYKELQYAINFIFGLLYFIGTLLAKRFVKTGYMFAIVISLSLLLLSMIDFTVKKQWVETKTETTYDASFELFNGKHEIPIAVKKGKKFEITIEAEHKNNQSYNMKIFDEEGHEVQMSNNLHEAKYESKFWAEFPIDKDGTVKLIMYGSHFSGSFHIEWSVN
ncbi:hypothetical protein [Paenibacillus montanisoli]|uniref:Uncharacterized protein n=1 Tax=Paenibacillus montanisoli TaxID=2081970 RepID=A0A328TTN8_9BACL|nr:hypothetical protein [Paenibacillus montanisoli]RAP73660.1 hypothetical protein DL346_25675 [Paenibacillus montanisoli]